MPYEIHMFSMEGSGSTLVCRAAQGSCRALEKGTRADL